MAKKTCQVSVTFSEEYLEELMNQYPAATQTSQALRMAVQESVERRQSLVAAGRISDTAFELVRDAGHGKIENCQKIVLGNGDIVADHTDEIEIAEKD